MIIIQKYKFNSAKTIEDKLYFYYEQLKGYIQNLKFKAKNTKE